MTPSAAWAVLGLCLLASPALAQTDQAKMCAPGYARSERLPYNQYIPILHEAFRRAGQPISKHCHEHNETREDCLILDHIIPLGLGGSWGLDNLQLQPRKESYDKDDLERATIRAYCRGDISLDAARGRFRRTHP